MSATNMTSVRKPMTADPELTRLIVFKAKLIWAIRNYLHEHGALEIPMPILHRTREGAPIDQWSAVEPGSDQTWFLRHCMEDHLRRASAAHERVFEIGKAVRADGGRSSMHAHEFVVLELVFRRFSYDAGVSLIKGLLTDAISPVVDSEYGDGDAFRRTEVRTWDDILNESTNIAANGIDFINQCEVWLKAHDVTPDRPYTRDWEVLEDIMKYAIEPACSAPTLITDFPSQLQHVCSINPANGRARRISCVMNGIEISDGGEKFARSDDYRRIYLANAQYRHEALGLDGNALPEDFFADLDAMDEPAFTTGLGIDRLTALVAGCDIRRALVFPEG